MSVILHMSDTHFGTEQAPVVEALVALAARARPDLVVLSGDITQRATPTQFRSARVFLDRLAVPWLALPGNHDLPLLAWWTRLGDPYSRYRQALGAELEAVHDSDDLLVLGVNTTRAWRHVHGELSEQQIERVAVRLARARPMQLRVVVVHQPIAVMRHEDRVHLLRGHAKALPRWAAAGADVLIGGHIHLPYVLSVPGLRRQLWVAQAGTAVSRRVRPGVPNSVNLLRWQACASGCSAEQWDFDAGSGAFACVHETPLLLTRP
jgi:3',5'-cyclic AMP phosphodiesterase CpdA